MLKEISSNKDNGAFFGKWGTDKKNSCWIRDVKRHTQNPLKKSADLSLFKQTTGLSGRLINVETHMEKHNANFFQDVTCRLLYIYDGFTFHYHMMWICVEMMNNSDHLLWIYTPENNSMEPETWWDWKTFSFPFEGWPISGCELAVSFRECYPFCRSYYHFLPTWCTLIFTDKDTFSSGVVCVLAFSWWCVKGPPKVGTNIRYPLHLEDHPVRKWLGSPQSIRHETSIRKGNKTS